MDVRLLNSKGELQRMLAKRKALVKERPLHIQIRGADLSEKEVQRLKSDIEEMVHAELEHSLSRRSKELELSVTVALTGLPHKERILIESKLQKMLAARIPREGHELNVVVRNSYSPPGDTLLLDSINPLPPQRPLYVAVCGTEDVLGLEIDDGSKFNLDPSHMIVGLTISTDWAKQIKAWDSDYVVAKVEQDTKNAPPVQMVLTQSLVSTIVFSKPKFLGIWTDMYNLDEALFWTVLGGNVLTFNWDCDNGCQCTPAPLIALKPTSLDFGNQPVGTTSPQQPVYLSNCGNADLKIGSILATGDFAQINDCGSSIGTIIPPNTSCTITVTFTPTLVGSRAGAITISSNALPSERTIPLTGNGV